MLLIFIVWAALSLQCSAREPTAVAASLADHRDAFSSGICGGLHKAYTDLHNQVIGGQRAQRYVAYVSPPSGTADRLIGLVAAFMVALLTQRALLIVPHPMPYEALYEQPFINWTTQTPPPRVLGPVKFPATYRMCEECAFPGPPGLRMNCDVCVDDGHSVTYLNWIGVPETRAWHMKTDLGGLFPDVHTMYYTGNRGISVGMFHNVYHQRALHGMGLRPSTAFDCVYNYLLFPRPETLALVQDEMQRLLASSLVIGIQIRTDDKSMESKLSIPVQAEEAYRKYFACAQRLEEALGAGWDRVRWLVVSDSAALRDRAQAWYGDKVIVYRRSRPAHLAASATVDMLGSRLAAAEHWLLGMTDYQVISWWSGYGRTAAMRSVRESTVQALKEETLAEGCGPATMQSSWQLGEGYSGVRRAR